MQGDEVPVRSVARALDLVTALEDGPRTLGALAAASNLSKGTAHRLLATLTITGLVTQDPATATYSLGPAGFGILDAVVHGAGGLDVIGRSIMEDLSVTSRETVALHVRAGLHRICVAQVPGPQPVRYIARLGLENPVGVGAMGKVLLAFSEPSERDEIFEQLRLVAFTPATITDRRALADELEVIRGRGWSDSRGERAAGIVALSAPVFTSDARLLAALSILGPEDRLPIQAVHALVEPLRSAAAALTERIAALAEDTAGWQLNGSSEDGLEDA